MRTQLLSSIFFLVVFFVWFPAVGFAQVIKVSPRIKTVCFKKPVEVILRLNDPVPLAEYRLVMESRMVSHLDTCSLQSIVRCSGIYFAALYSSSYEGKKMIPPVTRDSGLYPFNTCRVNVKELKKPKQRVFYIKKEAATHYSTWLMRKTPSDFGINDQINTLPNIDSVRVVYVLK